MYTYRSWGIPESQLAAIGALIVESSATEGFIERCIWDFAVLDENDGPMFTRSMSMTVRIDLLSTLVLSRLSDPIRQTAWRDIVTRLKAVVSDRNTFVHGDCVFDVPNKLAEMAKAVRLSTRGTFRATFENQGKGKTPRRLDADQANVVMKRLTDVRGDLTTFLVVLWLEVEKGLPTA